MVQAKCIPPHDHVGDFDFPCSNENCQSGLNGTRSFLCEYCRYEDKSLTTLLHCGPCHVLFLEEKKRAEEEESDDNDLGWSKFIKKKHTNVKPSPALVFMADYFK